MGARAIYRPLPEIPEALRVDALDALAIAQFWVAADGSATVELQQGTPSPRLNQLLLAAFQTWRFFPALVNGQPSASTLVLRIPISVQ